MGLFNLISAISFASDVELKFGCLMKLSASRVCRLDSFEFLFVIPASIVKEDTELCVRQCAAVRTQVESINEPPHLKLLLSYRATCHGHEPCTDSDPATT